MPGYELVGQEELAEIQDVFAHGGVLFRHGFDGLRNDCYKVRDFERAFAGALGAQHALAVSSGTAALRVALAALGIGPGDEVITQSFTFVATVEAIIEAGATPVCAEVDATFNLDPADLEARITPRTRAVIAVHMLGTPARLGEISEICRRHGLVLVEDAAWGCGGQLEGRSLGTWGDVGTFSFDFAKTMTTGEGGMVVCKDRAVFEKAAAWHDHGHENNPAVPRWEDTRSGSGFNFRMTELQGAVGIAQLKKLASVVSAQRANRDLQSAACRELWRGRFPGMHTRRPMPLFSVLPTKPPRCVAGKHCYPRVWPPRFCRRHLHGTLPQPGRTCRNLFALMVAILPRHFQPHANCLSVRCRCRSESEWIPQFPSGYRQH
jgi:dTDP-4-amino-4,6-dideoxygalactose transaminase